jgi:hypothetical protein
MLFGGRPLRGRSGLRARFLESHRADCSARELNIDIYGECPSAPLRPSRAAKGYLAKLLGNARVVRYLAQHHQELLSEFQKIAELEGAAA